MDEQAKRKKFRELRAQLDRLGSGGSPPRVRRPVSADELKRALKRRKAVRASGSTKPPLVYRRDLPHRDPDPSRAAVTGGRKIELEEAVQGREVRHEAGGRLFMVSTPAAELPEGKRIDDGFQRHVLDVESGLQKRVRAACAVRDLDLEDFIFMDVESTGLGHSPLFLVGIMVWEAKGFGIHQFLARHYAEEATVIAMFTRECRSRRLLVTFNGKSFDFPFIRARAAATGVPFDLEPAHFDLLHECRRVWKDTLPDCRLQTLERRICRRGRTGDIPGAEIPDAYHTFVRTENAVQMKEILRHNMLDLMTLADLMIRLPCDGY